MLKKLKHKGVAMVEYGVLLAFVCGIGGLYMSDTSLSASIDNTITKVVKLLEGEDAVTSFKKKLEEKFLNKLHAPDKESGDEFYTLGKAIVSNKSNDVAHYFQDFADENKPKIIIFPYNREVLKPWLDSLPKSLEGVDGLYTDKVMSVNFTDPQTSKKYEIQYAYSNVKGQYTYLLGSRILEKNN